jgi:tetraacyldisaccharide-1-P 4'-kinase
VSSSIQLFRSSHEAVGFVSSPNDEPSNPAILKGKRIIATSAIGNNRSFLRSLSGLGLDVVHSRSYLDHYRYTARDIKEITHAVVTYAAHAIVTTEKNLYTLRSFAASIPVPLYALSIRIILHDRERFVRFCKGKGVL